MSISFNGIPADIRTFGQYVEFDSSRAVQGLSGMPYKVLAIGQRLTTGTVAASTPFLASSAEYGEAAAGRGSILAEMIRAFKKANPYTELWAIGLTDDAGGTAATKTLTVTGPATADGVVYLYIGGQRITYAVTNGDAQNAIASGLKTAIDTAQNTILGGLIVTAGVSTNVVTLTCRHKGTVGNRLDARFNYNQGDAFPAGVSIAVAAGVTGATDPSMTTALTAIGDTQYNAFISALPDDTNMDLLESELADRWGPMVQKEGHAFIAVNDSVANTTTAGNARNSKHTTLMGLGATPTSPWIVASVVCAVDASDPDYARPRQTLELPGVLPPAESARFTREERNTLLTDGVSTGYTDAGGIVRIERLLTTYQTNASAIPDTSYLDRTTLATLAYLRWSWRTRVALKFPRYKLANDGAQFGPGQAIVTPNTIRSEAIAWFLELEKVGYVENVDQFIEDLIVERNAIDVNRVDMRMSPDLINQFIVLAGQIQFLL